MNTMTSPPTRFPGFASPGAGFEQPFELLQACHERVRRSLDLLRRLAEYIDDKGHDDGTRQAAADVLRYFELAAPLHHEDEEKHVFPRVLAGHDTALRETVQTLQRDHQLMSSTWEAVRRPLLQWRTPQASGKVDAATHADIARFLSLYDDHIEAEEGQIYPAVRAALTADELAAMGREMQYRRQQ